MRKSSRVNQPGRIFFRGNKMNQSLLKDARCLYDFLSFCPPCPDRADFILALGSHDLRVAEHAAKLYSQGRAPLTVCSGGFGKMTEGVFAKPEGTLFAERCVQNGVPAAAILVEDRAKNTGENFTLSQRLLEGKGFKTGLAVCKPYMARRALATGKKQWPEIQWAVSVPDIAFDRYAKNDEALADEIQLMVGDLQRLQVYAEKGFQAPTFVPDSVWRCWQRLVNAGFDRYVI